MHVDEEEHPGHEERAPEVHAQHDEATEQRPDGESRQDDAPREGAAEVALRDHRPDDLERRHDQHQEEERVREPHPQPAMPAHLVESGSQLGHETCATGAGCGAHADAPDACGADHEGAGVEQHGATRGDETHEEAAEGRADAERDAARDAEQRVGLLQPALRRDLRHETRRGGHEERRCGGVQRIQRDQVPDARLAAQEECSRRHLDDGAGDVGRDQDGAPRQAVGPHAADQHEHRLREDAREQDDAERGRRAPEIEHRERQRDREDAVAEDGDALRPEEERELPLAQDAAACARRPPRAAGSGRSSPACTQGPGGRGPWARRRPACRRRAGARP